MGTDVATIDFTGCERRYRPGYAANLVSSWIPALDGVQAKLEAGERRLGEVVTAAGFGRFRRVARTPFNLVYEARP